MTNGPIAEYAFLPWSRQGIASLLTSPDPFDDSMDANVTLPVHLEVNQARDADLDLRLYGPGDVVGLDPRQVIRTEPRDQTKDYIPNYLPAVEFDRPDLPWMFIPAAKGSRDRLRPWLLLVVVERQTGVTLDFNRQMVLPTLSISSPAIPRVELPPIEDSWAWAHVQISGDLEGKSLEQIAVDEPQNVSSRLVCPRKLLPNRDYVACLVPAFDAGVSAGLGVPEAAVTLAPAWPPGAVPDSIKLPVYYHWEFSTGSAGDFEALARLLEPRVVPETVGIRPMDISTPGFGMPDVPAESPGRILGLEGALHASTAQRTEWPAEARDPFQSRLRGILDAPHAAGPEEEPGPLIAPPPYGRWHAAQTTIPVDEPRWFRQLNLDPRERTVSGFGTLVVQDQQESLMHSAWEQVEDVVAANRLLVRAQLSRSVGLAIVENDLNPLTVDSLLQVTSPMHARVRMSPVTLRKRIHDSRVPDAAASSTFRRISRPRGPLARRISPQGGARLQAILTRLNKGEIASAGPRTKPECAITPAEPASVLQPDWLPGWLRPLLKYSYAAFLAVLLISLVVIVIVSVLWSTGALGQAAAGIGLAAAGLIAAVSAAGTIWARANRDRWRTAETLSTARFSDEEIRAIPPRPDFSLVDETAVPTDAHLQSDSPPGPDSRDAVLFREAAAEFQATIAHSADLAQVSTKPPLAFGSVRETMMDRLDPDVTVKAFIDQRISVSTDLWNPGERLGDPLEPIMAYPKFDRPMYEALRDISQDLLVPGLEAIKPNTITLLETNPPFIEAYMVGLNHEMGRELLWREFPSDQRGSYFRQFWDVRGRVPPPSTPQERERARDIPEIHGWRGDIDLGENMIGGSVEGSLVLLVRGELLRRFPTAMIYAAEAEFKKGPNGQPTRDRILTATEKYPLFRGTLHPDITFIGFDLDDDVAVGDPDPEVGAPGWFFVIQEQPTEPRFGLDIAGAFADDGLTLVRWADLSWGHLAHNQADFDAITYIRFAGTLPDTSGVTEPPGVAWGENAAHMAFITLQQPVRIAIHADDMLPA